MLVARDPLGIKPLCYAIEGPLFAAASESVALLNLGFAAESIKIAAARPGDHDHRRPVRDSSGSPPARGGPTASSSGSTLPTWPARWTTAASICRARRWARNWPGWRRVPIDEDTIVVPVPDTSKAAADAMAFRLGVPSLEGLIRNRYTGRTFIEGSSSRKRKAETKYTPLREVLEGKRVLLVEDSIVRSTTMKVLLNRIRDAGPGQGDSRPRGLPADRRPVLLRHRHVDDQRAVRPAVPARRPADPGSAGRHGRRARAPIRSATCRSSRSPGPSASTATSSARPASPASIPRPPGRSCIRSPCRTRATPRRRGPTKPSRNRWWRPARVGLVVLLAATPWIKFCCKLCDNRFDVQRLAQAAIGLVDCRLHGGFNVGWKLRHRYSQSHLGLCIQGASQTLFCSVRIRPVQHRIHRTGGLRLPD